MALTGRETPEAAVAALRAAGDLNYVSDDPQVLAALAVSGLPSDRFAFEGFLPRKSGARSAHLVELAGEKRTMVFYEAPHRIAAMIEAMAERDVERMVTLNHEHRAHAIDPIHRIFEPESGR